MERGEVVFEGKYDECVNRKGHEYSECGINYDSNEVNEVEMIMIVMMIRSIRKQMYLQNKK